MNFFRPDILAQLQKQIENTWSSLRKPSESVHFTRKPQPADYTQSKSYVRSELAPHVERAQQHLLSLQKDEGYWEGDVHDNVTITCEYVMFLRFLGLLDEENKIKCKNAIQNARRPDGSWSLYYGGPPHLCSSIEAYMALKICGKSSSDSDMQQTLEQIELMGGVDKSRVFTKIHLALFGHYPWDKIPVLSPELMLLPRQAPIDLYEFSSWSRLVIIPLLIIFDHKPVCKLEAHESFHELLSYQDKPEASSVFARSIPKANLEQIFTWLQSLVSGYEKISLAPIRRKALTLAEEWILSHQDPKGNWGGIFPAYANSILALHLRGYALDHPALQKGLETLQEYARISEQSLRMQSTISPVWDSSIGLYALSESGLSPEHAQLQQAADWLIKAQILSHGGDWMLKAKRCRPGGWAFEHENHQYPDLDDTAMSILSLLPFEQSHPEKISPSIDRAIEWTLGMQCSDGGWAAFDRDNNKEILNALPFADLKSLLDPSTPDVTGHVLEALGHAGISKDSVELSQALAFLKQKQEDNGSWFGRWGVNYIYGTCAVLCGLEAIDENMESAYILKSIRWIESIQNPDGGWGESCQSYDHKAYMPLGVSTPSQSAWALLSLLTCPKANLDVINKGLAYLTNNQNKDGSWDEPQWTGTGFPSHFYLRYDYYRLYFPLLALARARRA
ncbi:MAG: squalene--hopene cyclase [Bdellovibrionales bacterium]|nr:squalene--hopene cyclase [Bdellovibrionales bacterium]